jgi:hypothetical protein
VNRRCVPQALATFEMPILLSGKIENVKRRLYILADGWDPSPFRYFAKLHTGAPGWGHEFFATRADAVTCSAKCRTALYRKRQTR